MSDQTRILRQAREVWRASAPTEAAIVQGADRIAQRLVAPKRVWSRWYSLTSAGAAAALLGAIVHGSHVVGFEAAPSPPITSVALPAPPLAKSPTTSETPAQVALSPDSVRDPIEAPNLTESESESPEVSQPTKTKAPAFEPRAAVDPTWMDVSAALAAADHARAERLLLALSDQRHDANTRAKANLGLAQLDEARGDCAAAKQHALRASAIPSVEIKTVRRALELVARCNR